MFKIKLLILLLTSLIFLSCTKKNINQDNYKYSIGYIDGELDGLVLKALLKNNLFNFGVYDKESSLEINADIKHSSSLFITNLDNTSDRKRMNTYLSVRIVDQIKNCKIYNFEEGVSQFYIFADSNQYTSNAKAEEKIKKQNTEILVKDFINNLIKSEKICRN